jgi:glycosyltransferase involved in cell wall biosynthesis
MRVAIVHDYIKEFGGAERVLKTLTEIFPKAPIYTAFCIKGSSAFQEFKDKKIIESKFAPILKIGKLYSPLRFLIPLIWGSFDLSKYDLVITSASWYITRGFRVGKKTKVICYCHTPPRWLYGYETSVGFTKYWPVKVYAAIVGHFIRLFDFVTSQKINRNSKKPKAGVDLFIANSENVKERIKKFYRRDATVIYPPVDVETIIDKTKDIKKKENYFLIVSRLVGAKGIEDALEAFKNLPYKLKIVGEAHGFSDVEAKVKSGKFKNVELLGRVDDEILWELYAKAKGFIALARDEDFGMTVVEAQAAGTPVIAYNGGGFRESVINLKTGILINSIDVKTIKSAIEKLNRLRWNKKLLLENAKRFSKEKFKKNIKSIIDYRI